MRVDRVYLEGKRCGVGQIAEAFVDLGQEADVGEASGRGVWERRMNRVGQCDIRESLDTRLVIGLTRRQLTISYSRLLVRFIRI